MPSKQTENFHLSQWEPEDQVLRTDFNADNAKIDEALTSLAAADAAEAAARTALNTALSKKGNVTLSISTYSGNAKFGSANPTQISFSRMPTMFIVSGPEGILIGRGGQSQAYAYISINSMEIRRLSLSWSGTTCSFYDTSYSQRQMNLDGAHYVFSFFVES